MNIQSCRNTADAVPLYLPQGLYLKPIAKIHMSVSLPNIKSGKSVSNWEVMEKMRFMIQPDKFTVLKATNSSIEFIRFEGEIEDRSKLDKVLARLDGRQLKLTNISDNLRVRAAEAKLDFPSRHSWDSFFRDAKNMDESKPGERPDTIHISNLPTKWFVQKNHLNDENVRPSERIFCKAFERFGAIRNVDIPICDPYRHLMKSHMTGMKTFNFDQEAYFEGYVQFEEYMGFVRAMDSLRGMKLLFKDDHESFTININVDFDKNKHLSDACIRRRKIVRDRFIARDKEKDERARNEQEEEKKKKEKERELVLEAEKLKEEQRRQREEQRKMKQLELLKKKETEEISHKIAQEEKKLLITQRKLESIRLLEELFNRIKLLPKFKNKERNSGTKIEDDEEKRLRDGIVSKYKLTHEKQLEEQKKKLRNIEGENILKKILKESEEATPSLRESLSLTSLSSENMENESKKHKKSKKKKKKSKKKKHKGLSDSENSDSSEKDSSKSALDQALPSNAPPWFGYGPPNGVFPFTGPFYAPPIMSRGRPFFNRPFNHFNRGMMRGGFRGPRGFNPNWRGGRGRGGQRNHQMPANYYDEDDEYTRYFKRISGTVIEDQRSSYSRSYSRSRSRSRSRNRSRTYSRSRSRSRDTRSRSGRSRSRSRHSRSRRTRSRSRTSQKRSRSHNRSRSRSRSSKPKQRSSRWNKSKSQSPSQRSSNLQNVANNSSLRRPRSEIKSPDEKLESKNGTQEQRDRVSRSPSIKSIDSSKFISPNRLRKKRSRSRSWSFPRSSNKGIRSSWSKSPSPKF